MMPGEATTPPLDAVNTPLRVGTRVELLAINGSGRSPRSITRFGTADARSRSRSTTAKSTIAERIRSA